MDVLTALHDLEPDKIEPVYLLHGPERFFIDEMLTTLHGLIADGPMGDFNYQRIKARDIPGEQIVMRSQEIPMMSGMRLIIVDDAAKLNAKDQEALDPYLADPSPSTCLVLVSEKFDLRRGLFSRANKRKQVYKAEPLKEQSIGSFLKARAKARQVKMNQGSVAAVAASIGPDCAALDDAIERLGLFVGASREVTETDVEQVVSNIRQHSVFEMVDAIGNRQGDKALFLLESLLANRQEPLMINAMVARHIRQLLNARIHQHLGTDQRDMAKILGVPPFAVKKVMAQSRRFSGVVLERALARLGLADFQLKSTRRSSRLVIEEAVLDLCLLG